MSDDFNLSPQAVNVLFSSLESQTNCALWICTLDYSQQLYLSPNFEKIWQRDPAMIYQNQQALQESVDTDDLNEAFIQIATQQQAIKTQPHAIPAQTLLYRINRADGAKRFIKDRSFVVNNYDGEPTALAGVCYDIGVDEWLDCRAKQRDIGRPQHQLEADFVSIIERVCTPNIKKTPEPLNINKSIALNLDDNNYVISAREAQCIVLMLHGATAKQTAKQLGISPRTVETYIDQLKIKFASPTKLALIAKLANHPLILRLAQEWRPVQQQLSHV